jgi:transposase
MHSNSGPRRRHSAELKAKVLAACSEPGASISGVALAHCLNANLVRKWRSGRGLQRCGVAVVSPAITGAPRQPIPASSSLLAASPGFVAIDLPAPPRARSSAAAGQARDTPATAELIHVELRRGPLHLSVRWPTSAGQDCMAWLHELTKGLLK